MIPTGSSSGANAVRDTRSQTMRNADPKHADRLKSLSAELDAWMKAQKDEGKVFNTPRKLPAKPKLEVDPWH